MLINKMGNPYFKFKQFTVYHHRCAMKVGVDGVLLGCWSNIEGAQKVLDVGTGSGLIALMLAQRSSAEIKAIDINQDAVLQATENFEASPWTHRLESIHSSLQDFRLIYHHRFDVIVSNPPYFVNSQKTPQADRTLARHADELTHRELMDVSNDLLLSQGKLSIILPVQEGMECIQYGKTIGLFCSRLCYVYPKPGSEAKRLLLEFSKGEEPVVMESNLTIETEVRHQYTDEFTSIAKDFYLKM